MPKSKPRSRGSESRVKKMSLIPTETVSKLDALLSRQLAKPEPPTNPAVDRYDTVTKDLESAIQSGDPVAIQLANQNWQREYNKFKETLYSRPVTTSMPTTTRSTSPPPSPPPTPTPTPIISDDDEEDEEERAAREAEEKERAAKDPYHTPPTSVESVATPSSPATPMSPPKVVKDKSGKVALRYRCSECHKYFRNQGALTRHWRDKHSELGETPRASSSKTKKQTGSGIIFYPASSKR